MLEIDKIGRSRLHDDFLDEKGVAGLDLPDAPLDWLDGVEGLSIQFVGEHCTECAAPDCHASCDLFERGPSGRCRRFAGGLVAQPVRVGPFRYLLEALVKPWGQVVCVGNTYCFAADRFPLVSRLALVAGRVTYALQSFLRFLPADLQWHLTDRIRGLGNRLPRLLNRAAVRQPCPDEFVCVVGNPHPESVTLEFSIAGFGDSQKGRSFRRAEVVPQGWKVLRVPVCEVAEVIDLKALFRIAVVPLVSKTHLLQFLYLGFVRRPTSSTTGESGRAEQRGKKVKLLVCDLDNTLWDGVLVEHLGKTIPLRSGVREVLEELDRRGILLSIASKNNEEDARRNLEAAGVWNLFLCPQINWEPKSGNLERIVKALNIGMDTVAFVDDQIFEQEEVRSALPDVRVLDATELLGLSELPVFDVPVTDESRRRRQLYRDEATRRETEVAGGSGDFDSFLESCKLELELCCLNDGNRDRVHELVQRTNQLNYSGVRYSRDSLEVLLRDKSVLPVVMRCRDRFGDYGIVGFALVRADAEKVEIDDMMFSCRIQGKRIEHAFVTRLLASAKENGVPECICRYRPTKRNAHAVGVFNDLGFVQSTTRTVAGMEIYVRSCGGVECSVLVKVSDTLGLRERMRAMRRE